MNLNSDEYSHALLWTNVTCIYIYIAQCKQMFDDYCNVLLLYYYSSQSKSKHVSSVRIHIVVFAVNSTFLSIYSVQWSFWASSSLKMCFRQLVSFFYGNIKEKVFEKAPFFRRFHCAKRVYWHSEVEEE